MFNSLSTAHRKAGLRLAAFASLVAVFGAGMVVARATIANPSPAPLHSAAADKSSSGASAGRGNDTGGSGVAATGAGYGAGVPGFEGPNGPAAAILPLGSCGEPITAAVAGSTLDPEKMGFNARMLGAGFTITGISFGSNGTCGPAGKVSEAHLTMTTQWRYGDDGPTVMVTQSQASAAIPDVILQGSARFTSGGFTFEVWANSFAGRPIPVSNDGPVPAGTSMEDTSVAAVPPSFLQEDPRVAQAIDAAIAQLAPDTQQCFYRQVEGGWGDLGRLGIGDPRGAVPSGLSQQSLGVTFYQAPAAPCTGAVPFEGQESFSASFAGGKSFLHMSAYALPAATPAASSSGSAQPGHIGDSFDSWNNGKLSFDVSGSGPAITRDVLLAVAKSIDPSFSDDELQPVGSDSDGGTTSTAPSGSASSPPSRAGYN